MLWILTQHISVETREVSLIQHAIAAKLEGNKFMKEMVFKGSACWLSSTSAPGRIDIPSEGTCIATPSLPMTQMPISCPREHRLIPRFCYSYSDHTCSLRPFASFHSFSKPPHLFHALPSRLPRTYQYSILAYYKYWSYN